MWWRDFKIIEDMEEEDTMTQPASITERLNKVINRISYGSIDVSAPEYDEVRNFMYLWNLFEKEFFQRNYARHTGNVKSIQTNSETLSTLAYFQGVYANNQTRFNGLNFRDTQHRTFITNVLSGAISDEASITKAVIEIIYRYRCNLFHGSKEIASLWSQKDNFIHSNQFILACLEAKLNIK